MEVQSRAVTAQTTVMHSSCDAPSGELAACARSSYYAPRANVTGWFGGRAKLLYIEAVAYGLADKTQTVTQQAHIPTDGTHTNRR